MAQYALGMDIGATKVALALVDQEGNLLQASSLPTETQRESFLDRLAAEIEHYLKIEPQIIGIGIGCAGYIDPVNGVVVSAVNLNWYNLPLRDALTSRLSRSLPIYVQNDCTALALGELVFGAAKNTPNFVHIAIGTGLGGSAFVNGQPTSGSFEIGHIVRKPAGRLCQCGLSGCTEMYVSGRGLAAALAEHSTLSTTAELLQAARNGDATACAIMNESADALAELLTYIIVILNPSKVVIGGGLGLAALDFYLDGMLARFAERMPAASYQGIALAASSISHSAIGSASLVWHALNRF